MNKKLIFYFLCCFALNGCFQTTAMIGPAFTLASTGNVAHAGLTYTTNLAVEDKTGKTTTEHIKSSLEVENRETFKRQTLNTAKIKFYSVKKKIENNFKNSIKSN